METVVVGLAVVVVGLAVVLDVVGAAVVGAAVVGAAVVDVVVTFRFWAVKVTAGAVVVDPSLDCGLVEQAATSKKVIPSSAGAQRVFACPSGVQCMCYLRLAADVAIWPSARGGAGLESFDLPPTALAVTKP
jgi:hypothetical protein